MKKLLPLLLLFVALASVARAEDVVIPPGAACITTTEGYIDFSPWPVGGKCLTQPQPNPNPQTWNICVEKDEANPDVCLHTVQLIIDQRPGGYAAPGVPGTGAVGYQSKQSCVVDKYHWIWIIRPICNQYT